jgi:hypothetical protein
MRIQSTRLPEDDAMFIAAGTLWAAFGVLLRKHRLDPLLATSVIAFSALATYVPVYIWTTGAEGLLTASRAVFWTEVLVQGLIAGCGTLFAVTAAPKRKLDLFSFNITK